MSTPRIIPPTCSTRRRAASDPAVSAWVVGQCRLGQDACAGAARDPAAAARRRRRRRSSASPSPRPPPPTWRTACSRRSAHGRRSTTPRSTRRSRKIERPRARRRHRAHARAAAVRAGARDAGRPEGADHPRLLHAAAASVSVRGERRGALRGAGRAHARRELLDQLRLDVLLEAAAKPDSALGRALGDRDRVGGRPDLSRRDRRGDPQARRARRAGSTRAGGVAAAIAELSRALGVAPDETVGDESKRRFFDGSLIAAIGMARGRRRACAGGSKTDKEHGARFHALRGARPAPSASRPICRSSAPAEREPRKNDRHQGDSQTTTPACAQRLLAEQDRVCGADRSAAAPSRRASAPPRCSPSPPR